jgi:hypothetical protein
VKNGAGMVFWPFYGLNAIGNMVLGQGYQVKMSVYHTLDVTGLACVPEATPIAIPAGWSIIGYLMQSPHNIEMMMSNMVSNVIIVKSGTGTVYWPYWGLNAIGNMLPGQGYQIDMSVPSTLIYPPNGPTETAKLESFFGTEHYTGLINTGNNMTLGIPESAWVDMPQTGDEVGIFNASGVLIGSGVYTGTMIAITLWGDDFVTPGQEGISDGQPFMFRLWNHITGEEQELVVASWLEGTGSYAQNGISVVEKFASYSPETDAFTLYQNTPNPFRLSTEIKFYLPSSSYVTLEVFNALGELTDVLVSAQMDKGLHSLTFGGENYVSGVYFYRITTDGYTSTKTMNVIR